MGGGQGQTQLGQIAQEVLDHHDMEKRMREEAEELERKRQQQLIWAYYFVQYIAKEQEATYQKFEHAFDLAHKHQEPLPSRDAIKSFAVATFALTKVMDHMDNFDKKYHLDHENIKGINFLENRKTVMTPEEKAAIPENSFTQRDLNVVLFAVQSNDPDAGSQVAKDAIEEYAKGNKKPLGHIIGQAIRNSLEKVKGAVDQMGLVTESASLRELLSLVEEHPGLKEFHTLSENEMNESYGAVTKGFLLIRGMQAKVILEQAKVAGFPLPEDTQEECEKDLIMGEVIAKEYSPIKLANFGFTIEKMAAGIVPQEFLKDVDSRKSSMDPKELENLLEPPVLKKKDDEKLLERENPVLAKQLEQKAIDAPILGGGGLGLGGPGF